MRYLFVFGCDRSGTTFLATSLAKTSEEVILLPEAQWLGDYIVFRDLGYSLNQFLKHCNVYSRLKPWEEAQLPIRDLLKKAWNIEDIKSAVDFIFKEAAASKDLKVSDNAIVVEHTPWNWKYYPVYKRILNDSGWIHIIRDGRDVAISITQQSWGANTLYFAFRFWTEAISNIELLTRAEASDIHELKYEAFLTEKDQQLKVICELFKLTYSPRQFELNLSASYSEQHSNINREVDLSKLEVWKKLSEKKAQVFKSELIGIRHLKNYDYEVPEYAILEKRTRMFYWLLETLKKIKSIWV